MVVSKFSASTYMAIVPDPVSKTLSDDGIRVLFEDIFPDPLNMIDSILGVVIKTDRCTNQEEE